MTILKTGILIEGNFFKGCKGEWITKECGCKKVSIYINGCGKRNCPKCGIHKTNLSALNHFDRILNTKYNQFQFMELTVPKKIRYKFEGLIGAKLWAVCLRDMFSWMKENLGTEWAYQRSHPAGDDGSEFHPHANFIFVTKIRGKLPVEEIRKKWAKIIEYKGEVDIHVNYLNRRLTGKIFEKIRYIERPFPNWNWRGTWGKWYGTIPELPEKEEKKDAGVCPYCGQEYEYRQQTSNEMEATIQEVEKLRKRYEKYKPPEWAKISR